MCDGPTMIGKLSKYETDRLIVSEWHSLLASDKDMAKAVMKILTPRVTRSLPESWQGEYSEDRTARWIEERDQEAALLLVLDRSSKNPVGLMILFESDEGQSGRSIRVGYMLAEAAWGKGFATELLRGFIDWCRTVEVSSVIGGVERDNVASQRVMEKNGFAVQPRDKSDGQLLYRLDIQ